LLLHTLFNMVDQRKKAKKAKKNSKVAPKGPTITIPKPSKPPTAAKLRPKPKPAYRGASSALSNSEPDPIGLQEDGRAVDDAIQGLLGLGAMLGGGERAESEEDEVEIVENGKRKRPISEDEGEGEEQEEGALSGHEDEDDDSSSEEESEDEGKY
jgi:hypothetical protein